MKREKSMFLQKKGWLIVLNLTGGFLFLLMLVNLLSDGPMLRADEWISVHISGMQTEVWTKVLIFVTDLNGVAAATILFMGISMLFWYKKRYRDLRFFLLSFVGSTLLFNLFKFMLQRARPEAKLFDLATYSFPSGHTTMATVLALSLYFIFRKRVGKDPIAGVLLLLTAVLWPVLIAFTRVYLNVHWTSDVLAGFGLGLFWVTLVYLFCPPEAVGER